MTRDQAEAFAREMLGRLAERDDPGGNSDWNQLALAAGAALAGDKTAIATFRRVFTDPGFAVSNSGFEVSYAALGLGLLGDAESRHYLEGCSMRFNGIDQALAAGLVLLA
jgi:hypothetical protein